MISDFENKKKSFIRFFAKLKFPHKPKVTQSEIEKALDILEAGDLILTKTNWQLSNLFILGRWKHVAMVDNDCLHVIEAVDPVVRRIAIAEMLKNKDSFCISRKININKETRETMPIILRQLIGKEYDFEFDFNPDDFYCSELILAAYLATTRKEITAKLFWIKHFFGIVLPDSFANIYAFEIIFQSKE